MSWRGDLNSTLTPAGKPSYELCEFALGLYMELAGVLGLLYNDGEKALGEDLAGEIEALIAQRAEARKNKDWATADRIRDELKARRVVLEDTPAGVKWKIEAERPAPPK